MDRLPKLNGVDVFSLNNILNHIEVNASLQGLGGVCVSKVYSITSYLFNYTV